MRITFLGHAGAFIETERGTILCDPWFNPAFFASWFPFPDNSSIDPHTIGTPDFLYVSHAHHDHFDARFLREHVSKDAVVILPDFPTDDHRRALESLGFHDFLATRNDEPVDLDGLRLMTNALIAPTDGAIGDSGLAIADGTATLFNQNDSKPVDLDALIAFGPYDAHMVQYSGAIWYPMVYDFSPETKRTLGRRKRANEMARAARFIHEIGAAHFFPFAGPPCFLDDELFAFNDVDGDDSNIFPDATVFLEEMRAAGVENGHLTVPGTTIELDGHRCRSTHPPGRVDAPFADKARYLRDYQARARPAIDAEKATWPASEVDVVAELSAWWEPLLAFADHTCAGVADRVLLEVGDIPVLVDFLDRRVTRWNGEPCAYRFAFPRPLVERCIVEREPDWVNGPFLSCRFEASRDGPYNEFIYNFFRALSVPRMRYAERYYAESAPVQELFELDGYLVQRRCPHLKADLTRFGRVEDGILTCALHGWRFELDGGRCLTSDDRRLYSRPLDSEGQRTGAAGGGGGGRCG